MTSFSNNIEFGKFAVLNVHQILYMMKKILISVVLNVIMMDIEYDFYLSGSPEYCWKILYLCCAV